MHEGIIGSHIVGILDHSDVAWPCVNTDILFYKLSIIANHESGFNNEVFM